MVNSFERDPSMFVLYVSIPALRMNRLGCAIHKVSGRERFGTRTIPSAVVGISGANGQSWDWTHQLLGRSLSFGLSTPRPFYRDIVVTWWLLTSFDVDVCVCCLGSYEGADLLLIRRFQASSVFVCHLTLLYHTFSAFSIAPTTLAAIPKISLWSAPIWHPSLFWTIRPALIDLSPVSLPPNMLIIPVITWRLSDCHRMGKLAGGSFYLIDSSALPLIDSPPGSW